MDALTLYRFALYLLARGVAQPGSAQRLGR